MGGAFDRRGFIHAAQSFIFSPGQSLTTTGPVSPKA
jgi:hypothetical protein